MWSCLRPVKLCCLGFRRNRRFGPLAIAAAPVQRAAGIAGVWITPSSKTAGAREAAIRPGRRSGAGLHRCACCCGFYYSGAMVASCSRDAYRRGACRACCASMNSRRRCGLEIHCACRGPRYRHSCPSTAVRSLHRGPCLRYRPLSPRRSCAARRPTSLARELRCAGASYVPPREARRARLPAPWTTRSSSRQRPNRRWTLGATKASWGRPAVAKNATAATRSQTHPPRPPTR